MFSRFMFIDLGIGKGVTVLAGLSVLGILGMVALYFYGEKLRARSKFTENEGVEPSPNHEFNSTESQYKA
ncbi:unnamed protein product [Penicillium bialowiezense]